MYCFDNSRAGHVGIPSGIAGLGGYGKVDSAFVGRKGSAQHVALDEVALVPSFRVHFRSTPAAMELKNMNIAFLRKCGISRVTA